MNNKLNALKLDKPSGIYRIRNKYNDKCYVGQSVNVTKRLKTHRWSLNRGDHTSQKMQRAWVKYGEDAFVFEVLATVDNDPDILTLLEQEWIDHLDAVENGYNISPFAARPTAKGMRHTEEHKKAVSERMKGNKYGVGTSFSDEELARRSARMSGENNPQYGKRAWNKGVPRTEEQKNKQSAKMKGRDPWNRGVTHSDETKAKMKAIWAERRRKKLEELNTSG